MTFKRVILWFAAAAAVGVGILWWQHSPAHAEKALIYRTATVQRGDVSQTVTGSGSLSAITTVEVGAQVSGQIIKLYVDYNDTVKSNQLIAEIDPTSYQAKWVQAEADLLSAQATLKLKQLNAKRSADLLEKRLLSQSDYDTAEAELLQQEANLKKAEGAVNSARLDVEHCKITSPIDGVVLSRPVDVGQTVQSAMTTPTLFKLAQDLRQMQITANISEADIGGVAAGQTMQFTVDAFANRIFEGRVREIRNNSSTTNNVVTYPTIITVDNSDLILRPGMTANVTLFTARRTGVLKIANAALRFKVPDGASVRKGNGDANQNHLTPTNNNDEPPEPSLDDMPADIRQKILADFDKNGDGKLDEEEKKSMREAMRARFADGPGLPPPGAHSSDKTQPAFAAKGASKILYVLTATPDASGHATGALIPTPVSVGLSDSTSTEILSGVAEGAVVAIGTTSAQATSLPATQTNASTNNPFAPPHPPAGGPPPH